MAVLWYAQIIIALGPLLWEKRATEHKYCNIMMVDLITKITTK